MKKERATTSDEQRERLLIAEQIERAAAEATAGKSASPDAEDLDKPKVDEGLKRDETEKVVLSFNLKPSTTSSSSSSSSTPPHATGTTSSTSLEPTQSTSAPPTGLKLNTLKDPASNPLKRPNIFKLAASSKATKESGKESEKANGKKRDAPMSAAERLIFEDQERKRRRMERDTGRLR